MHDTARKAPLPDYDSPPVVETILGVQFDPLAGYRNAHSGAFWKTLNAEEWPSLYDLPPLPPQFERFAESTRWAKIGTQLTVTQDLSTRLQIKNREGDRMVQLQNGRLHFNWLGRAGGKYPRYERVRGDFVWALQRFVEFVAQEKVGDFRPNQWEVTYLNHIPKGTVWHTPNDWGFFLPLAAVPTIEQLVEGESFAGGWHFAIPEKRGRLHVEWQHGRLPEPEEEEVIVLTLTARGPVAENEDFMQALLDGIDLGRETIVRSFAALMSKASNEYWGLKNASD